MRRHSKIRPRPLRWVPEIRGVQFPRATNPMQRIKEALPLPAFLCIHSELYDGDRVDAECVEILTGRPFSVECGKVWARVYVPTSRYHYRSRTRPGQLAERLLTRFG
jgi:hypothetical protein